MTREGSEPSLDSDLPSDQIFFKSILLEVGITVSGGSPYGGPQQCAGSKHWYMNILETDKKK